MNPVRFKGEYIRDTSAFLSGDISNVLAFEKALDDEWEVPAASGNRKWTYRQAIIKLPRNSTLILTKKNTATSGQWGDEYFVFRWQGNVYEFARDAKMPPEIFFKKGIQWAHGVIKSLGQKPLSNVHISVLKWLGWDNYLKARQFFQTHRKELKNLSQKYRVSLKLYEKSLRLFMPMSAPDGKETHGIYIQDIHIIPPDNGDVTSILEGWLKIVKQVVKQSKSLDEINLGRSR